MREKNNFKIFVIGIALLTLSSCVKESYLPTSTKMRVDIAVEVANTPLEWNTIKYYNAAGNQYGVNKLNFYISAIKLKQSTGKTYTSKKVFYIDPSAPSKSYFILDSIPPGVYTDMTFAMGVDTANNKPLKLSGTLDNINMSWPETMGGGYHHLKFEGHYLDSASQDKGFAIHLGKNENLPYAKVESSMNQKYWDHNYTLFINLNEIMAGPKLYDFNINPNYTMMDSLAMDVLKYNIADAFRIVQNK